MTIKKLILHIMILLCSVNINVALANETPLNNGVIGLWSTQASNDYWQGAWIWHKQVNNTKLALFRKSFTVNDNSADAVLKITATSVYKLYVNGVYVSRGPARSAPHHQSYDVLNITSLLQQLKNSMV